MGPHNDALDEAKIPQTEVTLTNLRDEAVQALSSGKPFTINSTASQEGSALRVTSQNADGGAGDLMIVDGSHSGYGNIINEHLNGQYKVVKEGAGGVQIQNDTFKLTLNNWDAAMGRGDKGVESVKITGTDGKPIQTYEPAVTSTKIVNGQVQYDANGQEERVTRPDGTFDANTHLENPANPGNHRRETDYILHDAALAKKLGLSGDAMSLSLTSETIMSQKAASAVEIHGVLRTVDGSRVLGIINQEADLDANGTLVDVQTSSRLPRKPN